MSIKLYIVPHTHLDLAWYWTAADFERMVPELLIHSMLRQLEADPQLPFVLDQPFTFERLREAASEQDWALVLERVQAGRLEPVGGMYVQPELQEPGGESLVRQLQKGQRWFRENLGRYAASGWNIDTFGQLNQLPQLLRLGGMNSLTFMRDVDPGDDPQTFPTEFWFEGLDGSRILTHWMKHTYVLCESGQERPVLKLGNLEVTAETEQAALRDIFAPWLESDSLQRRTGLALLPWGDDLYPLRMGRARITALLQKAAALAGVELRTEDIIFATAEEFFAALRQRAAELPVRNNDFNPPLYRQDLRALHISRMALKQGNRAAEQALLSLENLKAAAGQGADTNALWEPVLYNQFHDILGGSCTDETYLAALADYDRVLKQARTEKERLFTAEDGVLTVYNPTQFSRKEPVTVTGASGIVRDSRGQVLPSWSDPETGDLTFLPGVLNGFETAEYTLEPGAGEGLSSWDGTVENEHYRLSLDPETGDLTGILEKASGRQLLRETGNMLVFLEERDTDMEGAFSFTGREMTDRGVKAQWVRVEKNTVLTRIRCRKELPGFAAEKQILLWRDCPWVEFRTDILDYTGEEGMLHTEFSLDLEQPCSEYETPFGVQRHRDGFFCGQNWVGMEANGWRTALLNRGTGGCWAEGNRLRMTLLRGHGAYTGYRDMGIARGLPLYDDGGLHVELASERGNHSFSYALFGGSATEAELSALALRYNSPVEVFRGRAALPLTPPILSAELPLIVTSVSVRPEGGLCLRGYHAAGQAGVCTLRFGRNPGTVRRVDLLDQPLRQERVDRNAVRLELGPWEIVTLHTEP